MQEEFSMFEDEAPSGLFGGLSEEIREDVEGLIWLGYLEHPISHWGHDFVLRTLRGDEELLVGLVAKEFMDTIGAAKAQAWGTVAISLISVDSDEEFCPPVTRDKRDWARARFQYCTSKWLWPLALRLYDDYGDLLGRQAAALEAVENFFDGSLPLPMPFASSSTDRASSEAPPEAPQVDLSELVDPEEDSTPSS